MIIIHVEIKELSVRTFSIQENTVDINIHFFDGTDKDMRYKCNLSKITGIGEAVIKHIRKTEKEQRSQYDADAKRLDNYVNVIIEDEDKVALKIESFLSHLKEDLRDIRNRREAAGYLNIVSRLRNKKVTF